MHPPLTLRRHPMCADIIKQFQKCHADYPIAKFFGECTELKIKLDRCFHLDSLWISPCTKLSSTLHFLLFQKAVKRKANFEESKKFKERLQAYRKEMAENGAQ
uniref:COX assembly mitochondrial protein n=1 Tax=Anthurium amnicola TaxID=1678845 RepID=A0A1D1XVZ4_9ARAE